MTKMLEPCPFCPDGGEPAVRVDVMRGIINRDEYIPWCEKCQTEFTGEYGYFDNEDDAVDAWNTRYKRTCKWWLEDYHDEVNNIWTTECGERFQWAEYGHPKCCPNCGAEAVDDN